MSLFSSLTALARSLALAAVFVAALFFMLFALSPTLELLPGGMDGLVALLLAALILIWAISLFRRQKRR